ncbi:YqaE/Pmp3 family membrane protein, partial [Paenibacillus larvae]
VNHIGFSRYVSSSIICPPLAVLFSGKSGQAIVNVLLWILGVVPGVVHAIFVVNEKKANDRMMKQAQLMSMMNNRQ